MSKRRAAITLNLLPDGENDYIIAAHLLEETS